MKIIVNAFDEPGEASDYKGGAVASDVRSALDYATRTWGAPRMEDRPTIQGVLEEGMLLDEHGFPQFEYRTVHGTIVEIVQLEEVA